MSQTKIKQVPYAWLTRYMSTQFTNGSRNPLARNNRLLVQEANDRSHKRSPIYALNFLTRTVSIIGVPIEEMRSDVVYNFHPSDRV